MNSEASKSGSWLQAAVRGVRIWAGINGMAILLAVCTLIGFLAINLPHIVPYMGQWDQFTNRLISSDLYRHSMQAIGAALLAWVYALIYLLATACCGYLYLSVWEWSSNSKPVMTVFSVLIYLLFTVTAVMPISLILYQLQGMEFSVTTTFFSALLFVNGLFLYLGMNYMAEIKEEITKSYVVSAIFKSSTRKKYLTEHLSYFLLSNVAPVYYFIITFTLMPELLAGGFGANTWFHDLFGSSIVYDLFVTALKTGFSEQRFWSLFCSFVFFVLLIRLLLIDSILSWWEIRHGIERSQ